MLIQVILYLLLITLTSVRHHSDIEDRRRLRSASSTSLDVWCTRLFTVGDRAFPVAAARLWNSLPSHVTAAPSLSIFYCHLKSHLFSLSYPAFWLFSHLCSVRAVTCHFGHFNQFHIHNFIAVVFQLLIVSAALTSDRIITGLSKVVFSDILETGDTGLAGPDNLGLEPYSSRCPIADVGAASHVKCCPNSDSVCYFYWSFLL